MRVYLSLNQIVEKLGGTVSSEAELKVHKVASLAFATQGSIGFFNDTKYADQLANSEVGAVIIKPEHQNLTSRPKILTNNPYTYFAKVSQLLNPSIKKQSGIHASAMIDTAVNVPKSCSIAANVVIETDVTLGENVVIGAGSVIEHDCVIGDNTTLEANVTIKYGSKVGQYCHIFPGAVIASDGFGYAEESAKKTKHWVKIPQVGNVIIQDYVDVGANTCIDRGAIDDTVIEEGVKLDNLIQIAHNCRIGAHTVIAGCVGIAGSAVIGKHCKIGGAVAVLGHLTVADNVTISPGAVIIGSIKKSGTFTALMPIQEHAAWRKTAVNIRNINQLADRIKALESVIANATNANK